MGRSRIFVAVLSAVLFVAAGQSAGQSAGQVTGQVTGQVKVSLGFYNVENFYDTIPSPFYDDRAYTPQGASLWDSERYMGKVRNIARVIDDMGLDMVGLAEVENEGVVRDLVCNLRDDYNYIHRTSNDHRGMDIAFLYKGDKFYPEKVRLVESGAARGFLHIVGQLYGEDIQVLICHLPSRLNSREQRGRAMNRLAHVADSLVRSAPNVKLAVMGDFNATPDDRIFRDAWGRRTSAGLHEKTMMFGALSPQGNLYPGSYAYDDKWLLFDNVLVSLPLVYGEGFRYVSGGVFVRDYLLGSEESVEGPMTWRRGYPLRTFSSGRYTAGYSDHLPVFVVLGR